MLRGRLLAALVWLAGFDALGTSGLQREEDDGTRIVEVQNDAMVLQRTFTVVNDSFSMDGKPFRYIAGSVHYYRMPRQYWQDRLRKLHAAGLNAVTTYVEWSFHEPEPRQYRFDGDYDIRAFVQMAAEEGLYVILRPGPYICAEREFGGFPYWLLNKYPNVKLRTNDKSYMNEVDIWFTRLFQEIGDKLYGYGGPIISVQIENEYGSYFECDAQYREDLRDLTARHVPPGSAVLFTTDGNYRPMIVCGAIPGTLTTIDFGAKVDPKKAFDTLRNYMKHGPLVNSEYYPGWLTHWGEPLAGENATRVASTLRQMLDMGASVNFYMFYGGTNFGYSAGANYVVTYLPDITSYDYDAPLTEAGDPTPKYFLLRDTISKYMPLPDLPLPSVSTKASYGSVPLVAQTRLFSEYGRTHLGISYDTSTGRRLPTFEALGQAYGFVLYETTVSYTVIATLLTVNRLSDYALVYRNEVFQGVLSRMKNIYTLPLTAVSANDTIQIFVENQGRINYGPKLTDFKGILGDVKLGNDVLSGTWTITGFPLPKITNNELKSKSSETAQSQNDEQADTSENSDQKGQGPGEMKIQSAHECALTPEDLKSCVPSSGVLNWGPVVYRGTFTVKEDPLDTYIDTSGWGKGVIWVNGYNLGRYWPGEGPQITLYVPAPYLFSGENVVFIMEMEKAPQDLKMNIIDHSIFV